MYKRLFIYLITVKSMCEFFMYQYLKLFLHTVISVPQEICTYLFVPIWLLVLIYISIFMNVQRNECIYIRIWVDKHIFI